MTAASEGDQAIWTIPNLMSVGRLLCIPLFLWLLFGREDRFGAALLLGGLGATDWVDGWFARRFNQVSELGKILDPTADRLLLVTGIVAILVDGSVPVALAIPVVVREVLISLVAIGLGLAGARRIDVQWVGKAGTFCLMFSFPFFLAGASDVFWADLANILGWVFGIPGLVLGYWSAALYVPLARNALREGKAARHAEEMGVGSSRAGDVPATPPNVEDPPQR